MIISRSYSIKLWQKLLLSITASAMLVYYLFSGVQTLVAPTAVHVARHLLSNHQRVLMFDVDSTAVPSSINSLSDSLYNETQQKVSLETRVVSISEDLPKTPAVTTNPPAITAQALSQKTLHINVRVNSQLAQMSARRHDSQNMLEGRIAVDIQPYRGPTEVKGQEGVPPIYPRTDNDATQTAQCNEKQKHFIMIKTEKTGSSTLFSILARFIITNQLNVMVMTRGGHLDVTKQKGESPGWDIGPRGDQLADCLIHHSRYNESLYKYFKPDAKFITLVRDAESWYTSAVKFWPGQVQKASPEDVLMNSPPESFFTSRSILKDDYNGQKTLFHLSQLQWLGFDYALHNKLDAIKQYISYIVPKFDITFLTDEFDASLVLMKRRFCWDHSDILYKPQEVGGRGSMKQKTFPPLTSKARNLLLSPQYNLGDQLLYEAFKERWWKQPEVQKQEFWQEVKQFKASNAITRTFCQGTSASMTIPANSWSSAIKLNRGVCKRINYENYALLKYVAKYAIGKNFNDKL